MRIRTECVQFWRSAEFRMYTVYSIALTSEMMYVQQYGKIINIYWIKLLTIFFWRYSTGKKHVMMTIQRNWYTTFLYCFLFLIKINLTVLQKDWMFVIYCKNWIWMYSTLSKGLLADKPINVWKYIALSEKIEVWKTFAFEVFFNSQTSLTRSYSIWNQKHAKISVTIVVTEYCFCNTIPQ